MLQVRKKIDKELETEISVELEERLTSKSCAKVIAELLKYLLYQKHQIPFTCEQLQQLKEKVKPNDRNYNSIQTLLESVESISEQLALQLYASNNDVREIVILIGATLVSPKLVIKLQLPSDILCSRKHADSQHTSRKPLLNLMKSIFECNDFQDAMSHPLGLTSTFVLLQKADRKTTEFFMPKPHFAVPSGPRVNSFTFKFKHVEETPCECNSIIHIYNDFYDEKAANFVSSDVSDTEELRYSWYQSRQVIKGFKYFR